MNEKELATILISGAALTLSIWNFFRTMAIADRQYALTFAQDVSKWAAEVFSMFGEIEARANSSRGHDHIQWIKEIWPKIGLLIEKGALLFPGKVSYTLLDRTEHASLDALLDLLELMEKDRLAIKAGTQPEISDDYVEIRQRFLEAVRKELAVELRYSEALKILRAPPDRLELAMRALGWRPQT